MTAGKYLLPGTGPGTGVIASEVDAGMYKDGLAKQFHVYGYATNVSAIISSNAQIYDELSSAVTAIERGQKSNWHPSNFISGMNNPPLDVTKASIELLEVCREELIKQTAEFENESAQINKDARFSSQEKKDKIAEKKAALTEQKAYVFGLLEDIRNANSRERTFQWSRDFCSSLG